VGFKHAMSDWFKEIVLGHLWVEAVVLVFVICVIFLKAAVQRVIRLRPLRMPVSPADQPAPRSMAEQEMQLLDFRWLGDFDASASDDVKMVVRAYVSADRFHLAVFAVAESGEESNSMIEFSTSFKPHGNLCTNNSTQASVYVYPVDKLIIKAPWKKSVRELHELHLAMCDVVAECGFQAAAVSAEGFSEALAMESRRDFEAQVGHGLLRQVGEDSYCMTVKGAVLMTSKVWWRMAYGFLFGWIRPSDASLLKRARKQFTAASQQAGVYQHA